MGKTSKYDKALLELEERLVDEAFDAVYDGTLDEVFEKFDKEKEALDKKHKK